MDTSPSAFVSKAIKCCALAVVGATGTLSPAFAETFPSRPITIVVPFSAGGSSDVIARLLAQPLSQQLGQPVVVDNRPGAGATIGTAYAAKKGAEGYVVILAENTQTVAPALYERMTYDAVNDFAVVGYIGESPAILAASKASGIKSLPQLLERTKKTALAATIGTGSGTTSHFMSELYQLRSRRHSWSRLSMTSSRGTLISYSQTRYLPALTLLRRASFL